MKIIKSIIILFSIIVLFFITFCLSEVEVQQPSNANKEPILNSNNNLKDESLITHLDTNNIDHYLTGGKGGSVWLLKFYAPWCKHSQEFQKTFVEMSHLLKDHIQFGSIDCIADPLLLHRFEITAYPTIKLLYNGQLYEFQGERTIEYIVQFLQSGYKAVEAMPYPLIDQQEILKRQLELQYTQGMTPNQIEALEKQIKDKQEELEKKKLARKYLEQEHDHNEEQEIAEYNERMARKLAGAPTEDKKVEQPPQVPGNATANDEENEINSNGSLFDTIKDSKIAYLLLGCISTGLFLTIKKKLTKKSKFMKIA